MVKISKVKIILCNVLTLYLCTLFLVQEGKWIGYGLLVVWYLVNLQDARCNNKDSTVMFI